MNELLKALYFNFYQPTVETKAEKEINDCHKKLSVALEPTERKLVLHIIDSKDHVADMLSLDSFIAGFRLAWQLANELDYQKETRPILTKRFVGLDAISISNEKEGGASCEEDEES